MNLSFWEKQEILNKNQITVIGAGIVGLCTAIELKINEPDIDVLILERGNVPMGASTKNAGFACFGSVTEILSDLEIMKEEEVINIISKRYRGLEKLKSMMNPLDFNYRQYGGFEVFGKDSDLPNKRNLDWINEILYKAIGEKEVFKVKEQNFGFNLNSKLIYNGLEGQLNPAQLVYRLFQLALKHNIKVLYNTEVQKIEDGYVRTGNLGDIPYKKLAVCTNGFARQLIPYLEVVPARNQVLITKAIKGLNLKGTFHYDSGYVYFRNVGNRILLGGGRNQDPKNEETALFGTTKTIKEYLTYFLHHKLFPGKNTEIDFWWSGIMGIGPTKETIVSQISSDVFVGVRLGGMGVAIGSEIGKELADLIMA